MPFQSAVNLRVSYSNYTHQTSSKTMKLGDYGGILTIRSAGTCGNLVARSPGYLPLRRRGLETFLLDGIEISDFTFVARRLVMNTRPQMQYSTSQHRELGSDAAVGGSKEQRKPAHPRLTEDQQAPVGLDNPFWKSERDK